MEQVMQSLAPAQILVVAFVLPWISIALMQIYSASTSPALSPSF